MAIKKITEVAVVPAVTEPSTVYRIPNVSTGEVDIYYVGDNGGAARFVKRTKNFIGNKKLLAA